MIICLRTATCPAGRCGACCAAGPGAAAPVPARPRRVVGAPRPPRRRRAPGPRRRPSSARPRPRHPAAADEQPHPAAAAPAWPARLAAEAPPVPARRHAPRGGSRMPAAGSRRSRRRRVRGFPEGRGPRQRPRCPRSCPVIHSEPLPPVAASPRRAGSPVNPRRSGLTGGSACPSWREGGGGGGAGALGMATRRRNAKCTHLARGCISLSGAELDN